MFKRNSGQVLMISLWVLAILVVASVSISYRMMVEIRLSAYHRDKTKAYYLARACLLNKIEEKQRQFLALSSFSMPLPEDSDAVTDVNPEGMRVDDSLDLSDPAAGIETRYKIVDEGGKINLNEFCVLNQSNRAVVENLLVYKCSVDLETARSLVDKLIDFFDDDVPGGEDKTCGSAGYERDSYGYKQKDALITDISEIARVQGWEAVLDKLSDSITVHGDLSKVNVNSCDEAVLSALFNSTGSSSQESEDNSRVILDFRGKSSGSLNCFSDKTKDDIEEVLGQGLLAADPVNLELDRADSDYPFVRGGSTVVISPELKKYLAYGSPLLRFMVSCRINKIVQRITAVVRLADTGGGNAKIIYWHEG